MSTRVLVAYAASTGFTARHAADVASEIAEVGGLEVDVKPIAYVASIEPYVAVYLGWSSQSRAGQREMQRFLDRNSAHLADRRIWVVQRQSSGEGSESGRGPIRLRRFRPPRPPCPPRRPPATMWSAPSLPDAPLLS
jgi:hypothetical protein